MCRWQGRFDGQGSKCRGIYIYRGMTEAWKCPGRETVLRAMCAPEVEPCCASYMDAVDLDLLNHLDRRVGRGVADNRQMARWTWKREYTIALPRKDARGF